MNKIQKTKNKHSKLNKTLKFGIWVFLVICLELGVWNLEFAKDAFAQTLSLSISPPILELTIQPGKSFTQTYTIENDGVPVVVSAKIVPFVPLDQNGHPEIIEDPNSVQSFSGWFSFDPRPISLSSGESDSFNVKFTPPPAAPEKDYYFTLLFTSGNDNQLNINETQSQIRLGTNILLTISKDGNPQKTASISEFSAPILIDSFQNIIYKTAIQNTGSTFFKPTGTITVKQRPFGSTTTFNIAPENVLAGSTRAVSCIDKESIIPCGLPGKFLIGIYKATLSFTPDGSGQPMSKTIYSVAFPFSILIGLTILIILYRIIHRLTSRSRKTEGNFLTSKEIKTKA